MKINLLPEAKQVQRKLQKLNILSTTVSVSVVVLFVAVALLFYGLGVINQRRVNGLKKEISSTEQELKKYKKLEDTVISLENGLRSIKQIINGENKWSLFFEELEAATPQDVQIKSLEIGGPTAKAELIGKDVNSLARFVESFNSHKVKSTEENLFTDVKVLGYDKDGNTIKFSAEFNINKGAIWQSN